jgi:DNA invertase Pin-like site-specific DNA recombinase
MAMRYGYARVSTSKQDYANQVDALKAAGCERIFTEKASAKSTNGRREFDRLMKALSPNDTVVVTKLDRLARSSRDLHTSFTNFKSYPVASYRSARAGATRPPPPAG